MLRSGIKSYLIICNQQIFFLKKIVQKFKYFKLKLVCVITKVFFSKLVIINISSQTDKLIHKVQLIMDVALKFWM